MILETMVTTDGADMDMASTLVSFDGSNVIQYHTPGQTCDNDDNLHNTLPCEHVQCRAIHLFHNHHIINDVPHVPAYREAIDAEKCSFVTCIVIQVGTWHVR